jgi:hypothetical protein
LLAHHSSRSQRSLEEKVPLVGFPFGLSMSSETHLFRVVGAKFIAEELTARCAPRLKLSVHDGQMLSAKRAA